ncbi:thiamine-phosphate diphosphorylase [Brachyspira hampsonii]|uniref:Thiamine-phosphate synthase n=1 Tax=Brachyspira hampsonii TaxID=1287055 RepID=A0AAC9TSJ3_9SPIR|nr:thiamine phosphate synthase [Brachyspira hampsonii]ASJ21168.1 thiamine-phosphate diphosphorylase [Brachyspira hampsonii]
MLKDRYFKDSIYCVTAEDFSNGRNNVEVVKSMLEAGIKIIQYREKDNPNKYMREKYEECLKIRELTKEYDALFIIDDYADLAIAVEADGVHIGQKDMPIEVVRKIVGFEKIIGLSTTNEKQAEESVNTSADYIGIGPIFSTNTKPDANEATGINYLDYVVNNLDIPFVCIGGIKLNNMDLLIEHKAMSLCMLTEIVSSEDIKAKCELLIKKMKRL